MCVSMCVRSAAYMCVRGNVRVRVRVRVIVCCQQTEAKVSSRILT